jgi:hypothetical protein
MDVLPGEQIFFLLFEPSPKLFVIPFPQIIFVFCVFKIKIFRVILKDIFINKLDFALL